MQIEGSYYLEGSPEMITKAVTNIGVLSKCIPGCKMLREITLDKYWYQLTYGYEGTLRVGKISSPSRLVRCAISVFRPLLSLLDACRFKSQFVPKDWAVFVASKILKICPSFLDGLHVEFAMDGKGMAGSLNATGVAELKLQGEGTLVQYKGGIYLGGAGSLLQMNSPSAGGLDFGKLVTSFLERLQTELHLRTKGGISS